MFFTANLLAKETKQQKQAIQEQHDLS